MKYAINRSPKFEQLDLFREKPKRPRWESVPIEVRERVSELMALMLVECLRATKESNDRKEVVHER